jgi:hypothetical protein
MDFVKTVGGNRPRSGRHDRVNNDRYFHVSSQGWYALTREGLGGPFVHKSSAEEFVRKVIAGEIYPECQNSRNANS